MQPENSNTIRLQLICYCPTDIFHPTHSFLDKFLLLKLCPYDETIFVDADSLAFGDLNEYWSFFADATDFSAIGVNIPLYQKEGVWYNIEDIGDYGSKIQYKTRVRAGVCFIRKSASLRKLYADCIDIYNHYEKLHFHTCPNSIDECVFGVAMPMNQMKAVLKKSNMLAAYPYLQQLKADILHGQLSYTTPWGGNTPKGILLHWGTAQTYKPLYRFNAECLHYMVGLKTQAWLWWNQVKYEYGLRYWMIAIPYYFYSAAKKTASLVLRGIRRILNSN